MEDEAGGVVGNEGAAAEIDVTLRGELAVDVETAGRVDDDVGARTARDQRAVEHTVGAQIEMDAAAERLENTGDAEVEVLRRDRGAVAEEINAGMRAHPAHDRDGAVLAGGGAEIDDRAFARGVDAVSAAGRRIARGKLAEAEPVDA